MRHLFIDSLELKEHCSKKGENRFTNLLLRLSPLRSLQPDVLEELFFAGLIGNVQIDSVVPYILKMESSEYKVSQQQNARGKNIFKRNIVICPIFIGFKKQT